MASGISHSAETHSPLTEKDRKRASSPLQESSSKLLAIDPNFAATTIQQAYRAHRHRTLRAAIQPQSYAVVKEMDFRPRQWEKFKSIARDLQRSGHIVFAHGSLFPDHALFTDIRSTLASEDPAFDSSWNTKRLLRSPQFPIHFQNSQEYFESDLCKDINQRTTNDHYPNGQDMLAADAYLDNRTPGESAYHFYSLNDSKFSPGTAFCKEFLNDYIHSSSIKLFLQETISDWQRTLRHIPERFTYGQGRVYLIAIAKEILSNPEKSYVWRAHPYGSVCTCHGEHTSAHLLSLLEEDQKGAIKTCRGGIGQYRILAANLQRDSQEAAKVQIIALDSITDSQKKLYQDFMWSITHLIRNFHKLETLSEASSYEEIRATLLRIRFNPPTRTLQSQNDLYRDGLKTILKEKTPLLVRHYAQLTQDLPEDFFKELEQLGWTPL